MTAPHRNARHRRVNIDLATQRPVIAFNAHELQGAAQRLSRRRSVRRPPHPRSRHCLRIDDRLRRTGWAHDYLRTTSARSVPRTIQVVVVPGHRLREFPVFGTQVLRLMRAGLSRLIWPHQRGPGTLPDSNRGPKGTRQYGRRDDLQDEFGRRSCGERLANPTPQSQNIGWRFPGGVRFRRSGPLARRRRAR
jgi:hypothetical protein